MSDELRNIIEKWANRSGDGYPLGVDMRRALELLDDERQACLSCEAKAEGAI